jgi:hypothetical protein
MAGTVDPMMSASNINMYLIETCEG